MDQIISNKEFSPALGIPYKNITWEDIPGQPFGSASHFNLFVFGNADNIVDVEGAMAVEGSFHSPRGLSIGFQRQKALVPLEFSPELVRYLIGNNISMKGPLVVIGHAVTGGNFRAGLGSTYYIGKNDSGNQMNELKYLYAAPNGSPYWTPSDKGEYYLIPSYDTPRIIPASRIGANFSLFFRQARNSIKTYKQCIEQLPTNGSVTSNSYEWVLTGDNPRQNVFTIDVRPNGLVNKGIRFNIPAGSLGIVRLLTGEHAHLQYGLYGAENLAKNILYVFQDAKHIHMEKSSDIWGSILAPDAMFHGHPTGGRVSGNAALGEFVVNENSGFEFHWYPFVGGVVCGETLPIEEIGVMPILPPIPAPPVAILPPRMPQTSPPQAPITPKPAPPRPNISAPIAPTPIPPKAPQAPIPQAPKPTPKPQVKSDVVISPTIPPCPECPKPLPCPLPQPCPECPKQVKCPECPTQKPCPTCPEQKPCPEPPPCPTCPEQRPCPEPPPCPTCPEQRPCPTCPECPTCPICPECPTCPEQKPCPEAETKYVPFPVPVSFEMRYDETFYSDCEECYIRPGIIAGCIVGCDCCNNHEWEVMLYQVVNGRKRLVYCVTICHMGTFEFEVDYEEEYVLKICPVRRNCFSSYCKPKIKFNNIGVTNFMLE